MNVCLLAPDLCHSAGGVWHFYQWVAKQVGSEIPLLKIAPDDLLRELYTGTTESGSGVPFDTFRASVEATFAYHALEAMVYGQIGGMWIPFYRKAARLIKDSWFHGDVVENSVYLDDRCIVVMSLS